MSRLRIRLATMLACSVVIAFGSYMTLREVLIYEANRRADHLWDIAGHTGDPKIDLPRVTAVVAANFEQRTGDFPLLWQLRPILVSRLLPEFMRIPRGVIAMIYPMGWCDMVARELRYVLWRGGYQATLWNMVTPESAHTAVRAELPGGRGVLLDPYFQLVGWRGKELVGPRKIRSDILDGQAVEKTVKSVGPEYDPGFYALLDQAVMGAPEDFLDIQVKVPPLRGKTMVIGRKDEFVNDVISGGATAKLTTYWSYIGHKYNRAWTRTMDVSEPTRVTFVLTEKLFDAPLKSIITPWAEKSDNTISWVLTPGHPLVIRDGLAERSWLRLRSYVSVDQIIFEPLPRTFALSQ